VELPCFVITSQGKTLDNVAGDLHVGSDFFASETFEQKLTMSCSRHVSSEGIPVGETGTVPLPFPLLARRTAWVRGKLPLAVMLLFIVTVHEFVSEPAQSHR
jgi:hypothetical protein